mmetsp:Transcript_949/g.2535  ORF Transcript_949/g.2535 Transcript_949/m.2535 type:complete len:283 (-) Transcript_949:444-1292(-)
MFHTRLHGRRQLRQVLPVDASKKGVALDLVHTVRAEAVVHVAHETADEVLGRLRHGHLRGELEEEAPVDNLAACSERVVRVERRVAHQHFKHDGADAPPVALHAVPLLQQHLWGNVVWRANGGEGKLPPVGAPVAKLLLLRLWAGFWHRRAVLFALVQRGQRRHVHRLTQPKVGELQVAIRGEQEVVRLDVAVDVAVVVDGLNAQDCLRDVEARVWLRDDVLAHQQRHHVATRKVLHDEVEVLFILEGEVQLDDVRTVYFRQHVAFGLHVLDLPTPQHLRFP